ncbi:MAG: hypothetical protein EBU26_07715 [Verrucomicrobia bacterium]|jgi:hypothetical protein|nr:hypothetical protein [Verrucomicrobiota bacterium]
MPWGTENPNLSPRQNHPNALSQTLECKENTGLRAFGIEWCQNNPSYTYLSTSCSWQRMRVATKDCNSQHQTFKMVLFPLFESCFKAAPSHA